MEMDYYMLLCVCVRVCGRGERESYQFSSLEHVMVASGAKGFVNDV